MSTANTHALQAAVQGAFGQPAVHLQHPQRSASPLCGQVAAHGRGWARTPYTPHPDRVTCKKCRRAMDALRHTTPPAAAAAPTTPRSE